MPADNPDGIEHILVATGQNLEQNEIFGTWKWKTDTEELTATCLLRPRGSTRCPR
jgi:hypothetical protein